MNNGVSENLELVTNNLVPIAFNISLFLGVFSGFYFFVYGMYFIFKGNKRIGLKKLSFGLLIGTIAYLNGLLLKLIMNENFFFDGKIELSITIPLMILGCCLLIFSRKIESN